MVLVGIVTAPMDQFMAGKRKSGPHIAINKVLCCLAMPQ